MTTGSTAVRLVANCKSNRSERRAKRKRLRRALQKYIEDPLSEALIQGTINVRPAFIEVFLEAGKLYYRPVDSEKAEGVLLYEN